LKKTNGSVGFMSGSAAFDPQPVFAAVAVINAAINALAKSFAEQGIKAVCRQTACRPAR